MKKKKNRIPFTLLVIFVPAMILTVQIWNDYRGGVMRVQDQYSNLTGMYYLDGGNKIAALTDERDGMYLRLHMYEANTGNLIKEQMILANYQGPLAAATYQNNGVIIPTVDSSQSLQLTHVRDRGEVTELARSTLQLDTPWAGVHAWRGRLIVNGETSGSTTYLAEVRDAEVKKVILNNPDVLPSDPENISDLDGSFKNELPVPLFEVVLEHGERAHVSGILQQNGLPAVKIQSEDVGISLAQEQASNTFAKLFGVDNTRLVRAEDSDPKQVRFYNAKTNEWGSVVNTPKPVYQARVFLLNDQEVFIVGSSMEDEKQGEVRGYIYNEKKKSFVDAGAMVGQLSFEDLENTDVQFYKALEDDTLYYSGGEQAAGAMNVQTGLVHMQTKDQMLEWIKIANEGQLSFRGFLGHIGEGGVLVLNWAVWLAIPLLVIIVPQFVLPLLFRRRTRQINEGELLNGTIMEMAETGTYVNNQPLVRFKIRFEVDGERKDVELKKVISLLNANRIGDQVVISYNREKDKAMLISDEDLQGQMPSTIHHAVLERIDHYGFLNRGKVLLLHFIADEQEYEVPVVQPPGFSYRVGTEATLIQAGGQVRLQSYGVGTSELADQLALEAEVVRMEKKETEFLDRELLVMDLIITSGEDSIRKTNSLFVPLDTVVQNGTRIPMHMKREDYERELRLAKGKQGAATIRTVMYEGITAGERPMARITVDRGGQIYEIRQSIDPIFGVEIGDELWISYDEQTREALILHYSSNG
ncbi:hypothetical protein [Paenibacillus illinoisensis]|uniref:hypothetical protein n=1 Tax=Paenibacillus illinoisensis TaxID=59845 RepID=UPI003D2B2BE7